MKRLIALAALLCLILCGCDLNNLLPLGFPTMPQSPEASKPTEAPKPTDKPQATTPPVVETPVATQAPTVEATEPVEEEQEKVTVYLLVKTTAFDSGCDEFYYDEDFNIVSGYSYDIENNLLYTTSFESKDENGMPLLVRTQWPEGYDDEIWNLVYAEDGKLLEQQLAGSSYTGYQYTYDFLGNRTETREYYEGILQTAVYCEYLEEELKVAYCVDQAGNTVFECRIQDGRVVEKIFNDPETTYGYLYEYDENGNLIQMTCYYDGEIIPGNQYIYMAVEVDADRAKYLIEQQKLLIFIV